MLESLKCNHLKFEAKPASKRSIELAPWYSTEINVSMSESITMVTWTTSKRTICLSAYVHEYYILKIIFGWLALVWYTRIERELRLVYKHRVQIHLLPWAQWYKSSHVKTECVKKCNNVSNIRHYHGHFIQVQHTFLAKSFSSQAGCKETRAPMHVSRGNCCMKIFKV